MPPTRSPMLNLKGLYFSIPVPGGNACFLAPPHRGGADHVSIGQQIFSRVSRNRPWPAWQRAQSGQIEMIHVRVGEQNQVDWRQLLRQQRRSNQPFGADSAQEG